MYKYFRVSENKSVFNWTFCQLLTEKPNCTKIVYICVTLSNEDKVSKTHEAAAGILTANVASVNATSD